MASLLVFAMSTPAFAQESAPPSTHREFSPGLVAGGAGLLAAGILTAIGGGFFTFWAVTSHGSTDRGIDPPPYELLGGAIPIDLLAVGSIVGGAIMMALGARHVAGDRVSFSATGLSVAW